MSPASRSSRWSRTRSSPRPPRPAAGGSRDDTTWSTWTGAVKSATGRKGKGLFMPLRLALTGRDHGPELKNLLPLIGRERAEARLAGRVA